MYPVLLFLVIGFGILGVLAFLGGASPEKEPRITIID
jgi:hypothetical protein